MHQSPPAPHGDRVVRADGNLLWVHTRTHFIIIMGKLSRWSHQRSDLHRDAIASKLPGYPPITRHAVALLNTS